MQHIKTHYPEAQSLSKLKKTISEELGKHNMSPSKCIWGTSICSDEVNNTFNFISSDFVGPGPFRFGGISGLPFTGKTGFGAFVSHIPDDGGAFILYGPHIGVSNSGKIGELHREKQSNNTTCCGSLVAGLENVKSGNILNISHNDYQQGQVNKLLIENYQELKDSDEPIKTTTEIAYKQIKREITDIVASSLEMLGSSPVLLIGGIVINSDWDQDDYFEIRDISTFNK